MQARIFLGQRGNIFKGYSVCLNFFIRFSLAQIFFILRLRLASLFTLTFLNGLSLILRFYPLAENNQREESCETKIFKDTAIVRSCTAQNTI